MGVGGLGWIGILPIYLGFIFLLAYVVGKVTKNNTAALAIWYGGISYIVFFLFLDKTASKLATLAFTVGYYVLKKKYLAKKISRQENVL